MYNRIIEEARDRALKRAVEYEEETRKTNKKIPEECIWEMDRKKWEGGKNKWEKRREEVKRTLDLGEKGMKSMREGAEGSIGKIVNKIEEWIRERGTRRRKEKTEASRYNTMYKEIITEELPRYLRGRKKKGDRSLVARFRCGNESKGGNTGGRERTGCAGYVKERKKQWNI